MQPIPYFNNKSFLETVGILIGDSKDICNIFGIVSWLWNITNEAMRTFLDGSTYSMPWVEFNAISFTYYMNPSTEQHCLGVMYNDVEFGAVSIGTYLVVTARTDETTENLITVGPIALTDPERKNINDIRTVTIAWQKSTHPMYPIVPSLNNGTFYDLMIHLFVGVLSSVRHDDDYNDVINFVKMMIGEISTAYQNHGTHDGMISGLEEHVDNILSGNPFDATIALDYLFSITRNQGHTTTFNLLVYHRTSNKRLATFRTFLTHRPHGGGLQYRRAGMIEPAGPSSTSHLPPVTNLPNSPKPPEATVIDRMIDAMKTEEKDYPSFIPALSSYSTNVLSDYVEFINNTLIPKMASAESAKLVPFFAYAGVIARNYAGSKSVSLKYEVHAMPKALASKEHPDALTGGMVGDTSVWFSITAAENTSLKRTTMCSYVACY